MDFVSLICGQVTRTTLEMVLASYFHSTPMGRRLCPHIFNVHWPRLHGGSSAVLGSNSKHACHESVTLTTRAYLKSLVYKDRRKIYVPKSLEEATEQHLSRN
ncbi:hypothetical protein TNCV_5006401 [Trichonephila clavipes]|uniref:Uncharacterized protein n=1 Tax=Trichonephila clavipes TaxID=2585209 RepID=A0A8X6SGD8_TRICX|nr:hypothetical protein TNCV_5006401 [Trichonephila clavipes]